MDSFVVRVVAYHGDPQLVGTVYCRAGVSREEIVELPKRDPREYSRVLADVEQDELDRLVEDFEDEYGCQVSYEEDPTARHVIEFCMFEPSWEDQAEADSVVSDLMNRLLDWCRGDHTYQHEEDVAARVPPAGA